VRTCAGTFRRVVRISVLRTGYTDAAELYCASRLVASPCPESSTELASVGRMPARPHRTVDRVVEILETVSLSQRGVTLAELATAMGAAKSSVQELTNGLLARGYLIEEDRRFHLGPGPFILAARANKLAALSLNHEFVVELSKVLGCTVLVGVRVGDSIVFTDFVGEESPSLTFVARTHARRPLYTSAAGKTLLANIPDDEMYRLLDLTGPEQAGAVRQFLAELPEIRSRRLAFNLGITLTDACAVATPLLAPDGSLIAAISAAIDVSHAHRLDDIGEELKSSVAALGPKYGLNTGASRSWPGSAPPPRQPSRGSHRETGRSGARGTR
jgi:DNA-binding IclR family transcriptional regulator